MPTWTQITDPADAALLPAWCVGRMTAGRGGSFGLLLTTGDVLRLVVGSAAGVIAAGIVIGLALSMMLGRLLTTMLFGVQPLDPATFVLVAVVLLLTAAASTIGPAWRAARIDPAVALRSE